MAVTHLIHGGGFRADYISLYNRNRRALPGEKWMAFTLAAAGEGARGRKNSFYSKNEYGHSEEGRGKKEGRGNWGGVLPEGTISNNASLSWGRRMGKRDQVFAKRSFTTRIQGAGREVER